MFLNDTEIKSLCAGTDLISDYNDANVVEALVSEFVYPLFLPFAKSNTVSFGYNLTLSKDFIVLNNLTDIISKLTDFNIEKDEDGSEYVMLLPNHQLLGTTNECINVPDNVMCYCVNDFSYIINKCFKNAQLVEPGFNGKICISYLNQTKEPKKVYLNKNTFQLLFCKVCDKFVSVSSSEMKECNK